MRRADGSIAAPADLKVSADVGARVLLARNDVDDPRHGVRTINCRRSTPRNLHPLDHRQRNHIEVDRRIRSEAAEDEPAAVQENQRPCIAEASQIDAGRAVTAVRMGIGGWPRLNGKIL